MNALPATVFFYFKIWRWGKVSFRKLSNKMFLSRWYHWCFFGGVLSQRYTPKLPTCFLQHQQKDITKTRGYLCSLYVAYCRKLIFEKLYINWLIDLADLRQRSLNMGHIFKLFEGNAKIWLESLLKIWLESQLKIWLESLLGIWLESLLFELLTAFEFFFS